MVVLVIRDLILYSQYAYVSLVHRESSQNIVLNEGVAPFIKILRVYDLD